MQNPFDDFIDKSRDTDRFIPTSHVQTQRNTKNPLYSYVLVGLIYLLEIITIIIGGMNSDKNNGLFFEYSNCIINDIPDHEFNNFEEIDIAIYSNIYYLRQATYPVN